MYRGQGAFNAPWPLNETPWTSTEKSPAYRQVRHCFPCQPKHVGPRLPRPRPFRRKLRLPGAKPAGRPSASNERPGGRDGQARRVWRRPVPRSLSSFPEPGRSGLSAWPPAALPRIPTPAVPVLVPPRHGRWRGPGRGLRRLRGASR